MVVPRFQLFEFEDQVWFPSLIRGFMTDYLQFVADKFDFYEPLTPTLIGLLERTKTSNIVDLASGSGGGWSKLLPRLNEEKPEVKVTCTDFFPNNSSDSPPSLTYLDRPVDAREVPSDLPGLRTMFLSFHHFRPSDASLILESALRDNQPIFIVEAQKRDISHLIRFALSPLFVLLFTPLIRPFSLSRILFTYLIPIIPVFVWWDGIVSVLRTYRPKELIEMAEKIDMNELYDWEFSEIVNKGVTLLTFSGMPKEK